jgi:hypothetical protein
MPDGKSTRPTTTVRGDQHNPHPHNSIASSAIAITPWPAPSAPPKPLAEPVSNLVVSKHASHHTVVRGERLHYTITVTNRAGSSHRSEADRRLSAADESGLDPPDTRQLPVAAACQLPARNAPGRGTGDGQDHRDRHARRPRVQSGGHDQLRRAPGRARQSRDRPHQNPPRPHRPRPRPHPPRPRPPAPRVTG